MTAVDDALRQAESALAKELTTGAWKPAPGDPLAECEFIRAGFRSWGLEAPDKAWKIVLSRLDFGDSNPSALLTVYAPGNDGAFGDLGWFAFSHSIGVNGGTNYNQCIKRLSNVLGGSEADWGRRVTYLIGRAKGANAGSNNGTFSITGRPGRVTPPPFVFQGRIREGRTMSVFGPGSAGKTTFVDGLVASACSGKEVVPDWLPSRRYTSLLLDWDEGREEEEVRLGAICAAYDIDLSAGYHYKRQTRPLHDVADEIGAYIVDNKIELVVVSPVGRAARSMGDNLTAPIDELYEILRSYATTNILIDHVTGSNMKGGADREFGSVRKRDNARGSYSLYMQSEEVGQRVVVLKNTKADALAPRFEPQAVRIEFDPPAGRFGVYDSIKFERDTVIDQEGGYGTPDQEMSGTLRTVIHQALKDSHMTPEELADATGRNTPSIRTVLNRYKGTWFDRLPSGKWEALPVQGAA
jgi:RecA/RadA recombinase